MKIEQLFKQGIALAKTPERQRKVEFYANGISETLAKCNAMLDKIDIAGMREQNESRRAQIAATDKLLGR